MNELNPSPIKVLMVCRSLPCHVRGGLEFHVLDLARGLVAEGTAVEILTSAVPSDYRENLLKEGLIVHEISGVASDRYSLGYLRRIGSIIDQLQNLNRYDIIHGQEFAFGFWNPPRTIGAKVVLTVHGTITSETPLHHDVFGKLSMLEQVRALARFGRRNLYTFWWHRMLHRADLLLIDSNFTQRELAKINYALLSRVRLIPLGVDMKLYPEVPKAAARHELKWDEEEGGPLHLITVGRLEWQKGHDTALSALVRLKKDFHWRYHILGDGSASQKLRALAEELKITDRVDFVGRADDRMKTLMLAASDLFLWPERTHPAFGLVGLESMLMNTPVVAAARGAIPEIIDHRSGWLFDADIDTRRLRRDRRIRAADPGPLAEVLEKILSAPTELETKQRGLRERTLARFEPSSMGRETLASYKKILGRD